MEILKKNLLLIAIVLVNFISPKLGAQNFEELKDAFRQSYIQEAAGDFMTAISTLKGVYNEQSYELNLRLGWLAYQSGNFTESVAYYNRAITLMPYSIESRFGIVYPGAAMGNWSMVITQYEKILEINPNNSVAMYRLGLIYYGRKEYETGRKYFDKVVNLYPFDYDGLTMLGWSYYRLNNMREARVLFQKALMNTPAGTSAQEGLDLVKSP